MALIPCRECKTEVSTTAKTCPKCGSPIKAGVGWGRVLLAIALFLIVMSILGRAVDPSGDEPQAVAAVQSTDASPAADPVASAVERLAVPNPDPGASAAEGLAVVDAPPPAAASPWTYSEAADAMHEAKTKVGCTTSTNTATLDWPYKNVTADLCIRRGPRFGLDAYVQLNGEGQILCSYDSCSVRIRFDKQQPRRFTAVEASDNSSNIIFIKGVPKLIGSLRKSTKTVIEVEFYQAGIQTLEFNTEQFEW